jgi:hypothetical protein
MTSRESASLIPIHVSNSRCSSAFSRRDGARALRSLDPPKSRGGRRECRVKASPMARVREEMHAAVTTGAAGSSGIPRAMGYDLYALSLGTGVIAPIVARRKCVVAFATMRDRIARASAPGGQDHTISPSVSKADRLFGSMRPPLPRLTCRDDRDTPLLPRRDDASETRILKKRKQNILRQTT